MPLGGREDGVPTERFGKRVTVALDVPAGLGPQSDATPASTPNPLKEGLPAIPRLSIPYRLMNEDGSRSPTQSPRQEPLKSARHMTPVAAAMSLVHDIEQKYRSGSHGVRGRSHTQNSEHIVSSVGGHKKVKNAKRHVYIVVCIMPLYFIVVSLLRLNLMSTLYIIAFLISATTHPYLTGIQPDHPQSRSAFAVYMAGAVACVSLLGQIAGQIVLQFYPELFDTSWAELLGWCNFAEISVVERVRCVMFEMLLFAAAAYLKVAQRRAASAATLNRMELGGSVNALSSSVGVERQGTASRICSFSTVAVFSGMSAASHPSLIDVPFLLIFIAYCIAWSRNVDIEDSILANLSFVRALRTYCAVVYAVHYATFVPYLAKHIPNTINYKIAGLSWLHDSHGQHEEGHKWDAIQLEAGNVIHVLFLSTLFLLLCAYSYSKATRGSEKKATMFDVDMLHTGSMDVVDLTLQGMVYIAHLTEALKELRPAELKVRVQSAANTRSLAAMASRAEKQSGQAVQRVLTTVNVHGHRYSSRILVTLIAVVIVLQPSVISSIWLLVFLLSLLRRYVFFSLLTPVLALAVVHVLGVWVVAVANLAEDDSGVSNATMRRLEVAGLAASTCGGIESNQCQLILLPILGLLLASVSLTTKLWTRRNHAQREPQQPMHTPVREGAQPDTVVERIRVIMRKSFIAIMLFWLFFTACWTVDGAHAILYLLSLTFFFKPRWAEKTWNFVLAYVCLLLTVIYLFKVLETDFVPSLANVKNIGRDVVGFHERETWQFFPLFVLLFFAIKQRDLFVDKELRRNMTYNEDYEMESVAGRSLRHLHAEASNPSFSVPLVKAAAPAPSRSASSSVTTNSSATTSSTVPPQGPHTQMKFRLFVWVAILIGLPASTVLDTTALGVVLALGLTGQPTVLSGIMLLIFLALAFVCLTPWGHSFTDPTRRRVWTVARGHIAVWLTLQYFFQYHLLHDHMVDAIRWMQMTPELVGVHRFVEYDGGSVRCLRGLALLAAALTLSHLQVLATHGVRGIHLTTADMQRRTKVTRTIKQLVVSYCGLLTSIALFAAAVSSTAHFRSSVMSIPYAAFLCLYLFSPAMGFSRSTWLQVSFAVYAALVSILLFLYQFPAVGNRLHDSLGAGVAAYVGFRYADTLNLLWTHMFVYLVSLLNTMAFHWERFEGCLGVPPKKVDLTPPPEGCTNRAYLKYLCVWSLQSARHAVFDIGQNPLALADTYAYHIVLLAFLVGIVAQPDSIRAFLLLLLLMVTYWTGEAGLGLPVVRDLERWFFVTAFVWLLLIYQYFTYLGLPPDLEELQTGEISEVGLMHRLPYNVSSLGEYRYYLSVDVTPWELAIDVFVASSAIALWGVYKRRREQGRDPVQEYAEVPMGCTEFLRINRQKLSKARSSIWALYGSGVVPERVPYPLGDIHAISVAGKFPVPGCGCEACESPDAQIAAEEDFTPSANHPRSPSEKLKYGICVILPYITMTIMFVDGATGTPLGVIDMTKVFLSLVLFQTGTRLKWHGARYCRWIIRVYALFLLTSCVLYFPYVKLRGAESLHRHFSVKDNGMHAIVMILAYLLELLLDSRAWVWVLYYDQQGDIRSRDIGEKIQQEWLWDLDDKKRAAMRESERRKHKLAAVKLGHSSTEIMVCPVCARKPNDELCDDCAMDIEERAEKDLQSQVKPTIIPAPCTRLSALEERLLQEGFLDHAEYSALEATTAESEASSDTLTGHPLTLAEAGWSFQRGTSHGSPSETTRPYSSTVLETATAVSTITLKGKTAKAGQKEQKFVVGKKPRVEPISAQDEFTSLPFGHHLNRFVDALTKRLRENSLGLPAVPMRRYPALWSATMWFIRSHTDKICYLMFFIDFLNNPCLLSLPLPLSVVMYAMVLYPRPHVSYWLVASYYIHAMITIKCLCYSLLSGSTSNGATPLEETPVPSPTLADASPSPASSVRVSNNFADIQIGFPFLFGTISDFFGSVAWELMSLLAIIAHKQSMRALGLWSDVALYYKYDCEKQQEVADGIPVIVPMINCEEVIEEDVLVLPEADVEFCLTGGMLLKSTDGMAPRVVTHLSYAEDDHTIRDQDGCGGKISEKDLGWVLRDIGRLAEIAEVETDIPLAGGCATSAAKAAIMPQELNWGPWYFVQHNILDSNKLKTGRDYYLVMFCVDFLSFIMFMFSFYSIQGDTDSDLASSLSSNMLPGPLVLAQLCLLVIIIFDRIIYLLKSVAAKFVFQLALATLYFSLYSDWNAARLTQEVEADSQQVIKSFATGAKIVDLLFTVKILYLMISAQQIRGGYLELSNYFSFKEYHHPVFYGVYMVFRSVPFVYELKVVIDWTFTATTLKFVWWIKLQDIIHELYVARCDLEDTRLLKMERDKSLAFPPSRKGLQGCGISALLVCIIFFPLMYYSSFSPALTANYVEHVKFSAGVLGAPPIYSGREALPITDRRVLTNSVMDRVQFTRPSLFGFTFSGRKVQLIELPRGSQSVWWVPHEARANLVDTLWNPVTAREQVKRYDVDGDGYITLQEARNIEPYVSPLGPATCPPKGQGCAQPAHRCHFYPPSDPCCRGMSLWGTIANSTDGEKLSLYDETGLAELYGVGAYRMPHEVEMSMDLEVTRSAASEPTLLQLQATLAYVLPAAARVTLYKGLMSNLSSTTLLPNLYSPFMFNKRETVSTYVPMESTKINCKLVLEPGRNNHANTIASFSSDLVCESLFANGNPLDQGFTFTPDEQECFNMSKYYRWSRCPDYDERKKCDYKEIPLYIITASDTVAKNSGLGSLLASFSVTALYTTFVLTIGQLIRFFFKGSAYRVVLEDMQDPRPVEYIVTCMHYARCEEDLVLEEALYQELLRLYRSPESLREFTARDVV